MTVGLNADGITIKRLNEIITNFESGLRSAFGNELSFDPSTPQAQLNGIYAEDIAILYETAEALYTNLHPNYSTGQMLDLVSTIRGVFRKPATGTRVQLALTGVTNTIVPAGTLFSSSSNPEIFFELEENYYIGITTLGWAETTTTGAIDVPASTVDTIVNPFAGLNGVDNPQAGLTGREIETDSELRIRSNLSVAIPSQAIVESIWSGLLDVDDVADVVVYENDTNITNAIGMEPKSMYAIVQGGTDEDIAQVIFDRKTLGCSMKGDETVNVTDSNNQTHSIKFDRAVYTDVYVHVYVTTLDGWTAGDDDQIKQDIVTYANEGDGVGWNGYTISRPVYASDLLPPITGQSIEDSFHVTDIKVSPDGIAEAESVTVGVKEIALFSTDNITVNVT